jgi:hypothetical protein
MAPYVHKEECGSVPCGNGCWWGFIRVGWEYAPGFVWSDRYGEVPADHPIKVPVDEARRAGDIDVRITWKIPGALILPDGQLHWVGSEPLPMVVTMRDIAQYEDLLTKFSDHVAVPMSGRV